MPSQVFSACRAACIYACVYICTFMGASAAGDMGLFYRYNKTGMGWLRLVGSLKLYVSLKNIGLFGRALFDKVQTMMSLCKRCMEYVVVRLVGSLKLYVSLKNIDLFCMALFDKVQTMMSL